MHINADFFFYLADGTHENWRTEWVSKDASRGSLEVVPGSSWVISYTGYLQEEHGACAWMTDDTRLFQAVKWQANCKGRDDVVSGGGRRDELQGERIQVGCG